MSDRPRGAFIAQGILVDRSGPRAVSSLSSSVVSAAFGLIFLSLICMQTTFTPEQLKDPAIQRSNEILRTCVHCGFCTATCPTYQVLGDELDSPRGRIYLIKDMLENDRPADEKTVKHIDRCLSAAWPA
jgi:ferredoxin